AAAGMAERSTTISSLPARSAAWTFSIPASAARPPWPGSPGMPPGGPAADPAAVGSCVVTGVGWPERWAAAVGRAASLVNPGAWVLTQSGGGPSTLGGGQRVHPILVGRTESHDQRKGWIAQRSAVDL